MIQRITRSTPDDHVFEFRLKNRRTRKVFDRVVGVNGWVSYERALAMAITAVQPPRAMQEGRAPIVLDANYYRWHQWVEKGRMDLKNTGEIVDTMKI